jgi:hypothetical protein
LSSPTSSFLSALGSQNDMEGMIRYLKDAERFATNLQTRRWATDTLEQAEGQLAARKRADEEERQQRAAYEKQLADYEKKYGKVKKKK